MVDWEALKEWGAQNVGQLMMRRALMPSANAEFA